MKRKFSMFLNIAMFALSVCAIAIGVYSAKTASLNVGGTIGFIAHNCKAELSGTIQACATSEDTVRKTKTISAVTIGETDPTYTLNLNTSFGGAMQFSDMFDDGQKIIITLNIKNVSIYAIITKANIPSITGDNITSTVMLGANTIAGTTSTNLETNQSISLVITLTLNNTDTSFASNALISGTLFEFEKGNVEQEDILAGTWVFNETLNINKMWYCTTSDAAYIFNFTCNNVDYAGIAYNFLPGAGGADVMQVYNSSGWVDIVYKTINITSKMSDFAGDNGSSLLSWLQENATKQ